MIPDWLDYDTIQQHSLDMRQFMDFRVSTLSSGMRIIEAYNSSGLTFSLLPDRGMDIWNAHYKGIPLTWIAPGSPHAPDYGQNWLQLFNGGLLTTCGLTHVGPSEDGRDIHGNYTRLRANHYQVQVHGQRLRLTATIAQSSLFHEQLVLTRTVELMLGKPYIALCDEIINKGDQPTPFMLLYHCNLGYPLVRAGTQMAVASNVYVRDAIAQAASASWQTYAPATPRFVEQVFFHHVYEQKSQAHAALLNDDIGVQFVWNTRHMPYLTQWKNTQQGSYVCGIEPGNCIPEGQNAARDAGRLVLLQPDEKQSFDLVISLVEGAEAVQHCRSTIARIRHEGTLNVHCNLSGYKPCQK